MSSLLLWHIRKERSDGCQPRHERAEGSRPASGRSYTVFSLICQDVRLRHGRASPPRGEARPADHARGESARPRSLVMAGSCCRAASGPRTRRPCGPGRLATGDSQAPDGVPVACPIGWGSAVIHGRSRTRHIGTQLRRASSGGHIRNLCKQGIAGVAAPQLDRPTGRSRPALADRRRTGAAVTPRPGHLAYALRACPRDAPEQPSTANDRHQ
jgi:hypothetical protein